LVTKIGLFIFCIIYGVTFTLFLSLLLLKNLARAKGVQLIMEADKNINLQADDPKSIEQLCSVTWEPLYRFVYFKVQNREEAEDITQETYIKTISYIRKNNVKIDNFISFLKTVALNVLRDRWRVSKRQGTAVNFDDINPKETAIEDATEDMVRRDMIKNALNKLSEDQRTVIDLRILKGYSVADTAKRMDRKESTVRVMQYRAIQNLTEILKNEY
jgi:RNA polymerase sigma-70 factor (ECF subfamily)